MASQVSDSVLDVMGFTPLQSSRRIEAKFYSANVFAIQGFNIEEIEPLVPISGEIDGHSYILAVGNHLNTVSSALTGMEFTESEEKWRADHKCAPPYLIVLLGPTTTHEAIVTRAIIEDDSISTYDRFTAAKMEMKEIEAAALPRIISALECSFSLEDHPVHFLAVEKSTYGKTPNNETIHDIRMETSAILTVSRRMDAATIGSRLAISKSIAESINPKVAHLFKLALEDKDPLKKFLYFFLAIEIATHAAFGSINHAAQISQIVSPPDRVATSTYDFFERHRERWKNLHDRFVWCAVSVWTHLNDHDVNEFAHLKRIRDNIAHGTITSPPISAVQSAEKLAAKLQIPPGSASLLNRSAVSATQGDARPSSPSEA